MSSSAIAYFQKVTLIDGIPVSFSPPQLNVADVEALHVIYKRISLCLDILHNFTKTLPQEIRLCSNVAEKHRIFQMKPIIKKKDCMMNIE